MTESIHVERTGSFTLPFGVKIAIAYLSAEGEREWVPGWQPVYLHPSRPSTDPGTVFQTSHNAQATTWLILEFDPARGTARYGRFTQDSHIGTVSVHCEAEGPDLTRVKVSYSLTSFSPAGTALLKAMTERQYAAMLGEWRERIIAADRRQSRPTA